MGYLKSKQINPEDERELRTLAWKKLGSASNYETLLLLLVDAYEIGIKEGSSEGYLDGLKRMTDQDNKDSK